MIRLSCSVQNYAWGKPGKASAVAQLKEASEDGFRTQDDVMYAEMWMGTHPKGPSHIVQEDGSQGPLLKDYLKANPDALGSKIREKSGDLPFMFKILSINKALSIQAHPDKKLAERLHAERPDNYPDANHKPEMAISLTDFEAMCGFRPLEEVAQHVKSYPELRALIADEAAEKLNRIPSGDKARRQVLKAVFSSWISAPDIKAEKEVARLVSRLSASKSKSPLDRVILRLSEEYPGDRGCMGPLLMNYVNLGPGVAFVMHANEPHAYLRGDALECMACSDNVVRVGLTPKYRDVPTLVEMLTYSSGPMMATEGEVLENGQRHRFTPHGISEFEIETVKLEGGALRGSIKLEGIDSPSVFIVLKGSGRSVAGATSFHTLKRGYVFMLRAHTTLELTADEGGLEVAMAHVNLSASRRNLAEMCPCSIV